MSEVITPYTITRDGYTRSGVECSCALMYSQGIVTLHPCGDAHMVQLTGGGRTSYVRQITEDKDSLEYGTPGKEGAVKIYCDFSEPDATRRRIDQALIARAYLVAKAQGKKEDQP